MCLASPGACAEEFAALLRMTQDHPSVQAAAAEANAAKSDIDVAEAARKFQIGVGLDSLGYASRQQGGRSNEPLAPYLSASKLLYDHGRTDAEVQGRNAAHAEQEANVHLQRETINKQLITLYATALGQHIAGNILEDQIATLKSLRDKVTTIAQIDPGRASEVNQVQSRLVSTMANREARSVAEREAWQQITELLQHDVTLTHELPDLKQLRLLPDSLLLAEQTLNDHPALAAARSRRDESEAAYKVASKWNRPSWVMDVKAQSERELTDDGDVGSMQWFQGVTVQFSGRLNLYDGGAGSANAQGQSQRVAAAEAGIANVDRSLHQELERLWASLPLRERQLTQLKDLIDVAQSMREAGEVQFFAGRRSLTDLMGFDSEYYNARLNYEEQRTQYLSSQWLIMAALGQLSALGDKHTDWNSPGVDAGTATPGDQPIVLEQPVTPLGVACTAAAPTPFAPAHGSEAVPSMHGQAEPVPPTGPDAAASPPAPGPAAATPESKWEGTPKPAAPPEGFWDWPVASGR